MSLRYHIHRTVLPWLDRRFPVTRHNLRIRHEQLQSRLEIFPSLIVTQLLLAPLLVWLLWDSAKHLELLLWLAFLYELHGYEYYRWHQLRKLNKRRSHFDILPALKDGDSYGV